MSTISVDNSVSKSYSLNLLPYKIDTFALCLFFKHFFKLLNLNNKKKEAHKLLKDLGFFVLVIIL